jgi:hypothetical protein
MFMTLSLESLSPIATNAITGGSEGWMPKAP